MKKHNTILVITLAVLLSVNLFAQSENVFPRAVYIDPYWAGLLYQYYNPPWHPSWIDSNYYFTQLSRWGLRIQ